MDNNVRTPVECCACSKWFLMDYVAARLYVNDKWTGGDLCARCLAGGPQAVKREFAEQAKQLRAWADKCDDIAGSQFDVPTIQALRAAVAEHPATKARQSRKLVVGYPLGPEDDTPFSSEERGGDLVVRTSGGEADERAERVNPNEHGAGKRDGGDGLGAVQSG